MYENVILVEEIAYKCHVHQTDSIQHVPDSELTVYFYMLCLMVNSVDYHLKNIVALRIRDFNSKSTQNYCLDKKTKKCDCLIVGRIGFHLLYISEVKSKIVYLEISLCLSQKMVVNCIKSRT